MFFRLFTKWDSCRQFPFAFQEYMSLQKGIYSYTHIRKILLPVLFCGLNRKDKTEMIKHLCLICFDACRMALDGILYPALLTVL